MSLALKRIEGGALNSTCSAGGGIRTHEPLRDWSLSPAPLTRLGDPRAMRTKPFNSKKPSNKDKHLWPLRQVEFRAGVAQTGRAHPTELRCLVSTGSRDRSLSRQAKSSPPAPYSIDLLKCAVSHRRRRYNTALRMIIKTPTIGSTKRVNTPRMNIRMTAERESRLCLTPALLIGHGRIHLG